MWFFVFYTFVCWKKTHFDGLSSSLPREVWYLLREINSGFVYFVGGSFFHNKESKVIKERGGETQYSL